jgi:hypothetical protein
MNGNIYGSSLSSASSEPYEWDCGWSGCYSVYPIPPAPPANISTMTGEPIFVQSYINAYNTAFNQETSRFDADYQKALNRYRPFTSDDINGNFILGTFGSREEYNSISQSQLFIIYNLQDDENVYNGNPYLFISAGSGGGSGFMYLDWVIVTYGVPYVVSVF